MHFLLSCLLAKFDQSEKNVWVLKIKYRVSPFSHRKIKCPLLPTKIKYNKYKTPKNI